MLEFAIINFHIIMIINHLISKQNSIITVRFLIDE